MEDTNNDLKERNSQIITSKIAEIADFIQKQVIETLGQKRGFEILMLSKRLPEIGEKIDEALKVTIKHH